MQWTYTGKNALARAASQLFAQRARPCAISPYVFMTDPVRIADVLHSASCLPIGSTLIYRHFGAADKQAVASALREICFARQVQFLIGQDESLAREVGADGLHLPERELSKGSGLRNRYPDWVLSGAVHGRDSLVQCGGLDGVIVSPVFESESPSAGMPIGVQGLREIVKNTDVPVFALGGINSETVSQLEGIGIAGIAGVSGFDGRDM